IVEPAHRRAAESSARRLDQIVVPGRLIVDLRDPAVRVGAERVLRGRVGVSARVRNQRRDGLDDADVEGRAVRLAQDLVERAVVGGVQRARGAVRRHAGSVCGGGDIARALRPRRRATTLRHRRPGHDHRHYKSDGRLHGQDAASVCKSRHTIHRGPRVQRYTSQPTEMTMQRRDFIRLAGLGMTVDAEAIGQSTRVPPKKALMTVGTQHDDSNEVLTVLAALGVNHICSRLPSAKFDDAWSVDGLSRLRQRVESFGIALDVVPLPLSSNEISRSENPNILLGKSPERDREIDDICQMIRNAAGAGIPCLKYNLTLLGVVRTESTRGRGGATYSTFVYDRARPDPSLTQAGPVSDEAYWERITYFLERVIPV